QALERAGTGQPHVQVPEWVSGDGCALAEAATRQRLPAILARQAGATYSAGVASPQRLRIALEDRADPVVTGGVRRPGGKVSALVLGEQHRGHLADAGSVAVRLPASVEGWLREQLD